MLIVMNILGGVMGVVAAFAAFFIAGNLANGDADTVRRWFPYVFAALLFVMDVIVRLLRWRRIAAREREATVLTPHGAAAAPRNRAREVFEVFFTGETGGQYLHILPAWLTAIIVAALA